jgi:hypothetical protein
VKTIKTAGFAGSFDAVPKSRKELLFVTLYAVRNLIGEGGRESGGVEPWGITDTFYMVWHKNQVNFL